MADQLAWSRGDPDEFERFCRAALPDVYGFLLARCGDRTIAEDLTSETFMAAVSAYRRRSVDDWAVGWLIVVARRRLIDHWRREARDRRDDPFDGDDVADEAEVWDRAVDVDRALAALARLGPHHRSALTLRYLDGLPVAQVACEMGRGLHATEALLQRARRALRRAYEEAPTHA